MSFQIYADLFTEADQPSLADLNCGDEPWARAAVEWIKGTDVIDSIAKRGTTVWIFRTESENIVGFGSLGQTRRRWPPPNGGYGKQLIIPMLGIDVNFHGQPPDYEWRYSHQIMRHLISEARQRAAAPNSGIELLLLQVHQENKRAKRLYEQFDFVAEEGFVTRNHSDLVMSHRLAAE